MAHLGGFSEEALYFFQLAASERGYDEFSEEGGTYDFTRCVRADGTFYGTKGACRKGSETGAREKEEPKTEGGMKRRATAEGKAAAKVASRKAAGEKISAGNSRTRLFKEELEKIRDKMKGASPEEQNRMLAEASKRADERAKGGEGKAEAKPAGKPRATSAELKQSQAKLFDEAKAKRAAAKEAEKAAKQIAKETKGDTSKEARMRRDAANKAWDKASTAAERAQKAWMKEHERWSKAADRDEKKKMTPAQRAEARRIDKIIKERG